MYYRHKQNHHDAFYQETPFNINLYQYLKPKLDKYSPTFYLPNQFSMSVAAQFSFDKVIPWKNIYFQHPEDHEELEMNAFPVNFEEGDSPIIYFIYGVFGTPDKIYVQNFVKRVLEKKWRIIFQGRRAFSYQQLKSNNFLHDEELTDFVHAIHFIKKNYKGRIYLGGLSAGAAFATRICSDYDLPIEGLISISNPFNFGALKFNLTSSKFHRYFSQRLGLKCKELLQHLIHNHDLQKKLQLTDELIEEFNKNFNKRMCLWDFDMILLRKLIKKPSVFHYYKHINCDEGLHNIKKPALFIQSKDDVLCLPQTIPFDKLYLNENIMFLWFQRGNHYEYFSGLNQERYCYSLAIMYIEHLEELAAKNKQLLFDQLIMQNPQCKMCKFSFDLLEHQPLILPQCGHTFCKKCISEKLSTKNEMICPEDKIQYKSSIEKFPINREIEAFFKVKSKNFCEIHEKPLEYYCFSDQQEICQICIIFGKHKDHTYTFKQELKKTNQEKLEKAKEKMENFDFQNEMKGDVTLYDFCRAKTVKNLDQDLKVMIKQYNVNQQATEECNKGSNLQRLQRVKKKDFKDFERKNRQK